MARRLFDDDPHREQMRQEGIMRRIERIYEPEYRAEIERASLAFTDDWLRLGFVPQASGHIAVVEEIAEREAAAAIEVFGGRMLRAARKAAGRPDETKDFASTLALIAARFISGELFRRRVTAISDTTRNQVVRLVQRGFDEGLGQDGTGKLIRDSVPALSHARAALIARTETHSAANYGAVAAARETGIELRKEWVAALSERTRFQHAALSGKVIHMDESWSAPAIRNNTAYQIAHPGDATAPPHGTINCRCAISWVTED